MERPKPVHGKELIDLALHRFAEEFLHAAQIAEPFLTHIGDEGYGARRFNVRLVECANDAEH